MNCKNSRPNYRTHKAMGLNGINKLYTHLYLSNVRRRTPTRLLVRLTFIGFKSTNKRTSVCSTVNSRYAVQIR
jgi:hypothetical protein